MKQEEEEEEEHYEQGIDDELNQEEMDLQMAIQASLIS